MCCRWKSCLTYFWALALPGLPAKMHLQLPKGQQTDPGPHQAAWNRLLVTLLLTTIIQPPEALSSALCWRVRPIEKGQHAQLTLVCLSGNVVCLGLRFA